MICNDFKAMTTEQRISNLFNIKELVGPDHTLEIVDKLTDEMLDAGDDVRIDKKHIEMFISIADFIR